LWGVKMITKTCFVCGGTVTVDGGVDVNNNDWVCSSGCWGDYNVAVAFKKREEEEGPVTEFGLPEFRKNIKGFLNKPGD
jgi:hypothetical protein